jgi:hypothetical protein
MPPPVDTAAARVRRASIAFPHQRTTAPQRTPAPAPYHFEERRVGTAALLTLVWLVVLGVVLGAVASATLLTVSIAVRHLIH